MSFRKGTPKDIDPAAIQRGIDATVTAVASGGITRCGTTINEVEAALYGGAVPMCVVAANDDVNGLVLRLLSHVMSDGRIVTLPLDLSDPDYAVGDVVMYAAWRLPNGTVSNAVMKVAGEYNPVIDRIKVVVASIMRAGGDLRGVPLDDLAFATEEGWAGVAQGYIVCSIDDLRTGK